MKLLNGLVAFALVVPIATFAEENARGSSKAKEVFGKKVLEKVGGRVGGGIAGFIIFKGYQRPQSGFYRKTPLVRSSALNAEYNKKQAARLAPRIPHRPAAEKSTASARAAQQQQRADDQRKVREQRQQEYRERREARWQQLREQAEQREAQRKKKWAQQDLQSAKQRTIVRR